MAVGLRRAATALVVGGAALLAAGCGDDEAPAAADGGPRAEVRELVRERGQALEAGDVDAYLAPVTDDAREVEEAFAEGSQAVPLAQVDMVLGDARVDREAGAVRDASVEIAFRYEGAADDNPFRAEMTADFERVDGQWAVTAAELDDPAPIWATGPVEATTSGHFLVLSRPAVDARDEAVELAEDAYDHIDAQLDLDIDAIHVVVLAGDRAEFDELVGPDGPEHATAVATWEFRTAGMAAQARAQHRQMIVNLSPVGQGITVQHHEADDVRLREVLQHELAHLVLHRFTSPHTPVWVMEAAAMYLAEERRIGPWAAGLDSGAFEERTFEELHTETDPDPMDYAYANAAALELVDAEGSDTFWQFYRSFRDADSTAEAGRLLEHLYGFDAAELDERTRERIGDEVG